MIDKAKRNTLKSIAVAGSAAALPAWALSASANQAPDLNTHQSAHHLPAGLSLLFSDSQHAGAQLVSLTNETEADITLRHIYPGIVSTDNKTYDLNELLSSGEITIPKGATHVFRLNAAVFNTAERDLPAGLSQNSPMQVSTVIHGFDGAHVVTTTRSLLV